MMVLKQAGFLALCYSKPAIGSLQVIIYIFNVFYHFIGGVGFMVIVIVIILRTEGSDHVSPLTQFLERHRITRNNLPPFLYVFEEPFQFIPMFTNVCHLFCYRSISSLSVLLYFSQLKTSFLCIINMSSFIHSNTFPNNLYLHFQIYLIIDIVHSCPLGKLRTCYPLFPSKSKDSS